MRNIGRIFLGAVALTAVACGDSTAPPEVAVVTMSTTSATILLGETKLLAVTLAASDGTILTRNVQWASSNTAVASVTSGGVVTATGIGTATITADAGNGKSAIASITVTSLVVGKWAGLLGSSPISFTLVENAGAVSGSGTLIGSTTSYPLGITGGYVAPSVSITASTPGFQPLMIQGTVTSAAITGLVNGSGFVNQSITLTRQP